MAFRKGFSGNPNGRPRGSKNKHDAEIKNMLFTFISEQINELPNYFQELNHKERLNLILKLLPYVTSKSTSENDQTINADYRPQDLSHVPTDELKKLAKSIREAQEIKDKYNLV